MATITVFNKGHRTWQLLDVNGKLQNVISGNSIVTESGYGQRMAKSYPRDLTTSNPQTVIDNEALKRREQSVSDKEKALAAKEKELAEREAALAATAENPEPVKKAGRPKSK